MADVEGRAAERQLPDQERDVAVAEAAVAVVAERGNDCDVGVESPVVRWVAAVGQPRDVAEQHVVCCSCGRRRRLDRPPKSIQSCRKRKKRQFDATCGA